MQINFTLLCTKFRRVWFNHHRSITILSFSFSGKQHRPFSWTWLKMWCIAWWHSGREDEDDDEDIAGPESSRTGPGYEDTLTPLSAETPLPSTVSRCPSLSAIQAAGIALDKAAAQHEYKRPTRPPDLKTISSDSVCNAPIRELDLARHQYYIFQKATIILLSYLEKLISRMINTKIKILMIIMFYYLTKSLKWIIQGPIVCARFFRFPGLYDSDQIAEQRRQVQRGAEHKDDPR